MTKSALSKEVEEYIAGEGFTLTRDSAPHCSVEYEKSDLIIRVGYDYVSLFRRSPCDRNDISFVARILKLHDLKSLIRICTQ